MNTTSTVNQNRPMQVLQKPEPELIILSSDDEDEQEYDRIGRRFDEETIVIDSDDSEPETVEANDDNDDISVDTDDEYGDDEEDDFNNGFDEENENNYWDDFDEDLVFDDDGDIGMEDDEFEDDEEHHEYLEEVVDPAVEFPVNNNPNHQIPNDHGHIGDVNRLEVPAIYHQVFFQNRGPVQLPHQIPHQLVHPVPRQLPLHLLPQFPPPRPPPRQYPLDAELLAQLEAEMQADLPPQMPAQLSPRVPTPEPPRVQPQITASQSYNQLLELQNARTVSNGDPFDCPICFSTIERGGGIVLHDCLHSFCVECLQATINHCEEVQVKCPFNDGTYSCQSFLQDREIRQICTPEILEKYLKKSILVAESSSGNQAFHCKTPDCEGWCLLENDGAEAIVHFDCPRCNSRNCIPCQAIHYPMNCQLYQFQLANAGQDPNVDATTEFLQKMLAEGKGMHCPKCGVIVVKETGCDAITCSMCRTEICWATKGLRWGPRGYGDYSAGCQCRKGGKKCHPTCQNCH